MKKLILILLSLLSLIANLTFAQPSNSLYVFKAESGASYSTTIFTTIPPVSSWIDSTGSITGTMTTAANQPLYNCYDNEIYFDGVNDALNTGSINLGNTHTICFIIREVIYSDNSSILLGKTSSNYFGKNVQYYTQYRANNKSNGFDSGLRPLGYKQVVIVRNSTGVVSYYENGYKVPIQDNLKTAYLSTDNFTFDGISAYASPCPFNGRIKEIRIYNRALNSTELSQWNSYCETLGIKTKTSFAKNITCLGDSHTAGSTTAKVNGWTIRMDDQLDSTWNITIFAAQGRTAASVYSDLPNSVLPKRDTSRTKEIAVVWCGTNDITTNALNGTSTYNKVVQILSSLRATGFKTVLVPMMDRSTGFSGGQTYSGYQTEMATFNSLCVTNAATITDAFANFTSDPILTGTNASSNTTYFDDGTHLTQITGQNYVYDNYIGPAISGL